MNPDNRIWFLIALRQLACLTGPDPRTEQNPYHFHGTPKRVRIVSENAGYGPVPPPDEEVEQRLTISDTGGVLFATCTCNADGSSKKAREKRRKIDPAAAKTVLDAFAAVFQRGYNEGETYRFSGSLKATNFSKCRLSDLVRETVGMGDLFVMDDCPDPEEN